MDPNFVRDRPSLSGPFEGQGIVVMTGATAGIGQLAAQRINRTTRARLVVGARGAQPRWGEAFKLDLASLASVRTFAATVEEEIAGAKIALALRSAGRAKSI